MTVPLVGAVLILGVVLALTRQNERAPIPGLQWVIVGLAIPIAAAPCEVMAGSIVMSGNATTSSWTADWGNEPISDAGFWGKATQTGQGALQLTATLTSAAPITIDFSQDNLTYFDAMTGKSELLPNNFGFRITLNEGIINNYKGFNLVGVTFSIAPLSPAKVVIPGKKKNLDAVAPQASAEHPSYPHFHNGGISDLTNHLQFLGPKDDPSTVYTFGGGIVAPSDFTMPSGIVIHDFQVKGYERRFQLTETFNFVPIPKAVANPEPAAVISFSTGLLGVFSLAWWRHRRSTV
jgi:hypothetical protein